MSQLLLLCLSSGSSSLQSLYEQDSKGLSLIKLLRTNLKAAVESTPVVPLVLVGNPGVGKVSVQVLAFLTMQSLLLSRCY